MGYCGRRVAAWATIALALSPASRAMAQEAGPEACAPIFLGQGEAERTSPPLVVDLSDGRRVKLAEISAPDSAEHPGLAAAAEAELSRLITGAAVAVWTGEPKPDRYGRLLAHLTVAGARPVWVQERLVALGLGYVDTMPSHRACADLLYAAERAARAAGKGLWALGRPPLWTAQEAEAVSDRFMIVEGQVLSVQTVGRTTYLNFGQDWKRDFTATVRPRELNSMRKEGFDPLRLEGVRVRVRGYAVWRGGPQIALTHTEQVEILGTADEAAAPSGQ